METRHATPWDWQRASGSAIVRCLIEVLARKDVIAIEDVMGALSEPLSSDKMTKGEVPEPVPDLRAEVAQLRAELDVAKAQVWALGDFFADLCDALAIAGERNDATKAIRAAFIDGLLQRYRNEADLEERVQRQFRQDVFGEL